ncbi:MAG: hypothetical protein DHS20C18_27520 [Saprospiraceae bacterium]|nr:MAG: hypothetical protein DHS20C18_27520 [Saprospiraceae bacterium]
MMKQFIYYSFIGLLSVTMMLQSCKKDDDSGTPKNEFTLNGESFELGKGFLAEYGENGNGSYDFDVTLTSSSITYNEISQEFNGQGDVIYLDLNTSSESGLVDGTYNFSSDREAFTMVYGEIGVDVDAMTGAGDVYEVIGGTVTIEVDGNETLVEFDLTLSDNTKVTGRFKGVLRPA